MLEESNFKLSERFGWELFWFHQDNTEAKLFESAKPKPKSPLICKWQSHIQTDR